MKFEVEEEDGLLSDCPAFIVLRGTAEDGAYGWTGHTVAEKVEDADELMKSLGFMTD